MTPRQRIKQMFEEWAVTLNAEHEGRLLVALTPRAANLLEEIKRGEVTLTQLATEAQHDAHADMAVRQYAINLIEDGRILPKEIRPFIVRALDDHSSISKLRGRKPVGLGNVVRDSFILTVLEKLEDEFGLSPTRNPGTSSESGCSLIARELRHRGHKIQESGVAEVYGKRNKVWGRSRRV